MEPIAKSLDNVDEKEEGGGNNDARIAPQMQVHTDPIQHAPGSEEKKKRRKGESTKL